MKTVKIIIERSGNCYGAYAENVEGIYGMGDTVEETKESALNGLKLFLAHNEPKNIPGILKGEYNIVFKFDAESFFKHYNKIFTNAGIERLTGINQKLLHHYSSGLKKPRPAQRKKIEAAIHKLGTELLAVEL